MKKIFNFIKQNFKPLIAILIIIVLSILMHLSQGSFMRDVATILSIPSFLVNFFVWNQFQLGSSDLKVIVANTELKRKMDAIHEENFKDACENLLSNSQSVFNGFNDYLKNIKEGLQMNSEFKERITESYPRDIQCFYKRTKDYMKLKYSQNERASSLKSSVNDVPVISYNLDFKKFEELEQSIKKLCSAEFFVNITNDSESVKILKDLFGIQGSFIEYYNDCRMMYSVEFGGEE